VSEERNRQVKKMVLTLNPQQEAIHALFQLTSFAEDLLRVALPSLCQLISSNQQLLGVCDCVLTQTTAPVTVNVTTESVPHNTK